jgi:hypothetical protein
MVDYNLEDKTMKNITCSFCLTILVLVTFSGAPAFAGTYILDLCWQVNEQVPEPSSDVTIRLGVSDLGGGHLGFNGSASSAYYGNSPLVMRGNGEFVGNQLVLSLTGVMDTGDAVGNIGYYVRIDLGSLGGTYNGIGTFFLKSAQETETQTFAGTLSLIACPS